MGASRPSGSTRRGPGCRSLFAMLLSALASALYLISATITGTKIIAFIVVVVIVGGAYFYYRSRRPS